MKVTSQLGKRYKCSVCGTEALCTKAGEGKLECCGKAMQVQEAKPIPSSD
jgi:desulfoferrodoxin-like iron-binding protein